MSNSAFRVGDEPAIRRADRDARQIVDGYRCPFCGSDEVKISETDIAIDTERIELYCDNKPACEVKEFVVLARAAGSGRLQHRADVTALRAIDDGTRAEQESDGYEFSPNADGTETRVMGWPNSWSKLSRGERDNATLERRRRLVEVNIEIQ